MPVPSGLATGLKTAYQAATSEDKQSTRAGSRAPQNRLRPRRQAVEPVLRLRLARGVEDGRKTARPPHLEVEAEARAFLLLLGRRFVDDGDLQREIRVRPRAEEARRRVRVDFADR